MTQRKDIGARLENWGKCYRTGGGGVTARGSESRGGRRGGSPLVMTAIVIDRMRSASFGAHASRSSSLDYNDAKLIERACARLTYRSRTVLRMYYVWNAAPGAICRKLDIPVWPSSHFNRALVEAKAEIERIVDSDQD